jgi:hypothetical protein
MPALKSHRRGPGARVRGGVGAVRPEPGYNRNCGTISRSEPTGPRRREKMPSWRSDSGKLIAIQSTLRRQERTHQVARVRLGIKRRERRAPQQRSHPARPMAGIHARVPHLWPQQWPPLGAWQSSLSSSREALIIPRSSKRPPPRVRDLYPRYLDRLPASDHPLDCWPIGSTSEKG